MCSVARIDEMLFFIVVLVIMQASNCAHLNYAYQVPQYLLIIVFNQMSGTDSSWQGQFLRFLHQAHKEFNQSFNDLAEFHQPAFHQLKAEESSSRGKLNAFQQININGKETTGLSVHAFQPIANEMLVALEMREKYIQASCQEFHPTAQRHIRLSRAKPEICEPKEENVLSDDIPYHPPRGVFDLDPFFDLNVESLPEQLDHTWSMEQGIICLRGKIFHKT